MTSNPRKFKLVDDEKMSEYFWLFLSLIEAPELVFFGDLEIYKEYDSWKDNPPAEPLLKRFLHLSLIHI